MIAQILQDFEYLAKEAGRIWKAATGSAYAVRDTIADQIAGYTELLQQQHELERGVIPTRKPVATVAGRQ